MNNLKLSAALADYTGRRSADRREELVNEGRALLLEKTGREHNDSRLRANRASEDYGSVFPTVLEYNRAAAEWGDDLLYYCADKVRDLADIAPVRSDRSTFTARKLAGNANYLYTLSGVINDVVKSVTPTMVSDLMGDLASVIYTPRGKTEEIEVQSNAVFQWYDSSWTALRSVPTNQLYNRTVTLNPRPRACRFTINYYQMTAGGTSVVDEIYAIAGGYAAKLMDSFTTALLTAANNAKYLPNALKATTYTDSNWANLCQNVAKANHVTRDKLIAYGSFLALRNVLPSNATLAPAIMTMMGNRYFKNGYLQSHDGVALYEIDPAVKPATINSTFDSVFPDDKIVIAARANGRYNPMVMAFEDGGESEIRLTAGDDVLATGYIEGLAVTSYDIAPVFASRIGLMSGVTGA